MKLYSARASVRTALQQAGTTKYLKSDDPDSQRVSKKLPKAAKGKIAKALMTQTGALMQITNCRNSGKRKHHRRSGAHCGSWRCWLKYQRYRLWRYYGLGYYPRRCRSRCASSSSRALLSLAAHLPSRRLALRLTCLLPECLITSVRLVRLSVST